jgi:hypothetical protein
MKLIQNVCVALFFLCSVGYAGDIPAQSHVSTSSVLATVNDVPITAEDLSLHQKFSPVSRHPDDPQNLESLQKVLDDLMYTEWLAQSYDISKHEAEWASETRRLKALLVMRAKSAVTPDEVMAYQTEHPDQVELEYKVSIIVVKNEDDAKKNHPIINRKR